MLRLMVAMMMLLWLLLMVRMVVLLWLLLLVIVAYILRSEIERWGQETYGYLYILQSCAEPPLHYKRFIVTEEKIQRLKRICTTAFIKSEVGYPLIKPINYFYLVKSLADRKSFATNRKRTPPDLSAEREHCNHYMI